MASPKRKENQSCVFPNQNFESQFNVLQESITEIERLEKAYETLSKQYLSLKTKWETSHHTLEQLVHYMSDGLLFVTTEGLISLFNPSATKLTGLQKECVMKKKFEEVFSDGFFGFSLQEILSKNEGYRTIVLSLGNKKEIEVTTSLIPDRGLLLLLRDRTELKQLQTALSHADRLKELGEMAATLAHEIRNPLGGIEGFAHLLKRDLRDLTHLEMIEAILQGTGALNRLVSQVLEYARPFELHFAPIDLISLLQETALLFRIFSSSINISIECQVSAYHLSLDKERMKMVFLNLLKNAQEAEASEVKIILTQENHLIFKDNGKGIPAEQLGKIFTPFFTTKAMGTGLGLATSLSVVEGHGGKIEVTSSFNQGTEFTIKFAGKYER